jgi:hypothetical protein
MTDAERLILIRALATNCVQNVQVGANDDNAPLVQLIHELAFGMDLSSQESDRKTLLEIAKDVFDD